VELAPDVRAALRALRTDALTAAVTTTLEANGIRSILLKGPAIARWLYPRADDRCYLDCDLLVAPEDFGAAERVLAELGLDRLAVEVSPDDWTRHAATWFKPPDEVVDLHRTIVGVAGPPDVLWTELAGQTETLIVAGYPVDIPGLSARAFVVALNAAKDGDRGRSALEDLRRAVAVVSHDEWARAADIAERVQAVDAFATGLRMLPEGAAVADALALGRHRSTEVALRARGAPPLAVGMVWLTSGEASTATKLRVAVRKVFPPRDYLRLWSPLARRHRWGLAVAYLWRPLWVAWHLGPAARAWARSRRDERLTRRP
jgi:hypothetical protein